MGINITMLLPYEKFVQSKLGKHIDGRRPICGVFKDIDTGEVVTGDDFDCVVAGKGSAEESYKAAIAYFNYTIEGEESKREFVSAEWLRGGAQ